MTVRIKRVYGEPTPDDGHRILVDRLWPRGLKKERGSVERWLNDIAPSDSLRRWFGHRPDRWKEFKRRYFAELADKGEQVAEVVRLAGHGAVTLLYAAKDEQHNNAVALREHLDLALTRN